MKGKFKILTSMLIFGSIGLFVKKIDLSSSEIAFLRGVIGSLFLITASLLVRQRISFKSLKPNLLLLALSGTAIGANWILLFQAYKYTSISNATLCYYFAPVFVMILAPFVLKEKLTPIKVLSIVTAMLGLFLIINPGANSSGSSNNQFLGIVYALSAAVLYASVILMNKFIKNLSGFETTLVQLLMSSIILFPYIFFVDHLDFSGVTAHSLIYILIVGIVHTGIAYFLYFTSLKDLKGQTIAVLSYLDPISAVIMASIFLRESMSYIQVIGGVLILGSTFISELFEVKNKNLTVESGPNQTC